MQPNYLIDTWARPLLSRFPNPMLITFEDDAGKPGASHARFQSWRARHPDGFVVNFLSESKPILHSAGCSHFGNSQWQCDRDGGNSLTKRRKVCSDASAELIAFIAKEYSARPVACATCRPAMILALDETFPEPEAYVAYHSAVIMGGPYGGGTDFVFLSRKPEKQLHRSIGQEVWVIASEGQRPVRYFLAGVYTPHKIETKRDGSRILGEGIPFEPPIDVTDLPWFRALRKEQNNFSYGFNRIRSQDVISILRSYRDVEPESSIFPNELPRGSYPEGASTRVAVNKYERDRAARAACLQALGTTCYVCKTDLSEVYGDIAAGLIHVHHLTPLSAIGREYQVDPVRDLIGVAPLLQTDFLLG
ncbi:MAG: HNH endonuclease [Steroidobacteraceae bacterium]